MRIDILHGIQDQILVRGLPTARPVSLVYGMRVPVAIALYREDDGEVVPYTQPDLEEFASWQFAVDADWDFSTDPAVLASTGFAVAGHTVSFTAATNTTRFATILNQGAYRDGGGELKGYRAGETLPSIVVQFPVRLQNTRTGEVAEPPVELQPDFVTAAQAESIAAGKIDTHYPTTAKTTPADADRLTLWDSAAALARKYLTWANLKTALAADYGLLSTAQKATLTGGGNADALHTHEGSVSDKVNSPSGTLIAGRVYRQGVGAWVLADPDDPACETCELFLALGTSAVTHGLTAQAVIQSGAWGTNGAALWLSDDGGMTEVVPTPESHPGRVARIVGWIRDSESFRFDGHIPGDTFEEVGS